VFAFIGVPLLVDEYLFRAILIPFLILSLAALGRQYPGRLLRPDHARCRRLHGRRRLRRLQLSHSRRRHAAARFLPAWRLTAAVVGIFFGIPSLRVRGLYLAVATLAAQFFTDWVFLRVPWFTNNASSGSVSVANLQVSRWQIDDADSTSTCSAWRSWWSSRCWRRT
jgi:branched-chain amino acid transport system permease protein